MSRSSAKFSRIVGDSSLALGLLAAGSWLGLARRAARRATWRQARPRKRRLRRRSPGRAHGSQRRQPPRQQGTQATSRKIIAGPGPRGGDPPGQSAEGAPGWAACHGCWAARAGSCRATCDGGRTSTPQPWRASAGTRRTRSKGSAGLSRAASPCRGRSWWACRPCPSAPSRSRRRSWTCR